MRGGAAVRSGWATHARRVALTVALTTTAACVVSARAQPTGNQNRSDEAWLQAIQSAAQRTNYSGTIFYQQGAEVRVSRIVHQFDGVASRERLQVLDGERREYIRKADEVQCLLPEARRVIVEKRPLGSNFPALSTAAPADILRSYLLRRGPVERVADVECQVIVLEPKDGVRYGYKLWVERTTGLLLRAQMLNERQDVIEQMAFTDVHLGETLDLTRVKPSWSTDGWRVEKVETRPVDFASRWTLDLPEGFRQLSALTRRFAGGGRDTWQAVYSDGLATFSVFVEAERGSIGANQARKRGPINAYVHLIGDTMVTVVGEVPPETVKGVALSVKAR